MNYFDIKAISSSQIKKAMVSIENMLIETKVTDSMQFGTALHCLILEPEKFVETYEIYDYKLLSNANKENYKMIIDSGNIPLHKNDFEVLKGMERSLKNHPYSDYFIYNKNNKTEQEILFKYKNHDCKSKMDILNFEQNFILDLKTISDINKAINTTIYDNYLQSVFYRIAIKETFNTDIDFYFCYIETKAPYSIQFIQCNNENRFIENKQKIDNTIELIDEYEQGKYEYLGYNLEIINL